MSPSPLAALLEWSRTPDALRRHRIGPTLYFLSARSLPDPERERLKAEFDKILAENLWYLELTREALALLSPRMPVMPLKGVLFAAQFHPHIGCRPQSDIDFLIQPRNLEEAHAALVGADWREAVPRDFYERHYHWVYRHATTGHLLELHWALKPAGTCAPDLARVWKSAVAVEVEGLRFLRMGPEDLLEYTAVNKAMQHFSALLDFLDLHWILEKEPIDWDHLIAGASADGTGGALWFGLVYCRELLGTQVPDAALRGLSRLPSARGARCLRRALSLGGGPLRVPGRLLEGPAGRVYEAFLEGRPGAVASLFMPLVMPSRGRLQELAGGSYPKYLWRNMRLLARQIKVQ